VRAADHRHAGRGDGEEQTGHAIAEEANEQHAGQQAAAKGEHSEDAPPLALIVLGIAVALQNLFSHANLRLPGVVDRALRPFLVTPDMHRIHHSQRFEEQNSNYGFIFPWWDRLFDTYRAMPAQGHEDMRIGLEELADDRSTNGLRSGAPKHRREMTPPSCTHRQL
jgi:hypothetical protein